MNPRIEPLADERVPEASRAVLRRVEAALGRIPNLHRVLAHAPVALEAYVAIAGTLARGTLSLSLREQIAVATAGHSRCDYCAAAHTLLGKGTGLDAQELRRNLDGESAEPRVAAALGFARALLDERGAVSDEQLAVVREAGLSDPELVELVAHIGMNLLTNILNRLARTPVDFPSIGVTLEAPAEAARPTG